MKKLFIFIFWAIAISACSTSKNLEILHINDSHSYLNGMQQNGNPSYDKNSQKGGFARLHKEIQKYPNALLVDAGDRFQGTLYFALFGYEPLVKIDNAMNFSALTLGNHEFDNGCEFLNSYLNKLKTPILAANITATAECSLKMDNIQPSLIKEINGEKIGIIGISHDNPTKVSQPCNCVSFPDYQTAIRQQIQHLKSQQINKIVLITHLGLAKDLQIAENIADIDIIVGGHTHSYLGDDPNEEIEGKYPTIIKSPKNEPVLIVQAKYGMEYLGYLNVQFDENGVISDFHGKPIKLIGKADSQISEILNPYNEKISQKQQIIGKNEISMNDGLQECRQKECFSALLMSLAMLEATQNLGTQIAFNNSGNSRLALPVGDISELDLLTTFPFNDKIVVKELTGNEIKNALEQGISSDANKKSFSSMLQPANLKYSINLNNPPKQRISDIQIKIHGKWQPINFSQKYKVAMNSYLANGKSVFGMLKNVKTIKVLEINDVIALRNFVLKHTPIQQIETNLINFK